MKASLDLAKNQPFVFTDREAKRFSELLSKHIGEVNIVTSCADAIRREFKSARDLIEYENAKSSEIEYIAYTAYSEDGQKTASLRMGKMVDRTVELNISGPEPTVKKLKDELCDVIEGIRPWYWMVCYINFYVVMLVLYILGMNLINLLTPDDSKPSPGLKLGRALLGLAVFVSVIGLFVLLGWILNILRRKYFPMGMFAIGQGEQRHRVGEKIRWIVIIGFLLSVLASAMASLMLTIIWH
jgi:hypothetical protein